MEYIKTLALSEKKQLHVYFENPPKALYGDGKYDWMFSIWEVKGRVVLDWNDAFAPTLVDMRYAIKLADNFKQELKNAPKDYLGTEDVLEKLCAPTSCYQHSFNSVS